MWEVQGHIFECKQILYKDYFDHIDTANIKTMEIVFILAIYVLLNTYMMVPSYENQTISHCAV